MSDPVNPDPRQPSPGRMRSRLVSLSYAVLSLLALYGIYLLWGTGRIGGMYGWTVLLVLPVELVGVLAWLGLRGPGHPAWGLVIKATVCGAQAGAVAVGVAFIYTVAVIALARSVTPIILLVILAPVGVVLAVNAAFIARIRGVDWKFTSSD